MKQLQGMDTIRRVVDMVHKKVPQLHIKITDGVGNMTIYVEMTNGSTT